MNDTIILVKEIYKILFFILFDEKSNFSPLFNNIEKEDGFPHHLLFVCKKSSAGMFHPAVFSFYVV